MEEEMLKKDGVAILIVMVFIALLGLFGYWYGLFKQDDIIMTNEIINLKTIIINRITIVIGLVNCC